MLTLAVLQLGLALYVRGVVHDAAVEGAYHAALADTALAAGADRAERIVSRALGESYGHEASVGTGEVAGRESAIVTVSATLPLAGLLGPPRAWEVTGYAPLESLG